MSEEKPKQEKKNTSNTIKNRGEDVVERNQKRINIK